MCLIQCWEWLLLAILHCKELWKILPSFILMKPLLGVYLYLPWTSESPTNTRRIIDRLQENAVRWVMLPPYMAALTEEYSMMIYTVWKVSETWNVDEWIQRTMTAGMVECLLFRLCAYKQTSKSAKDSEKISSKYSPRGIQATGYKDWAQNWDLIPYTSLPLAFFSNG